MRYVPVAALCLLFAPPALAQEREAIKVPSGQPLEVAEVIVEDESGIARFRFVAPEIGTDGEGLAYADVKNDFPYICESYALPALRENGWEGEEIYVSLADRDVPFGEAHPEATQFLEIYHVEDGDCVWEGF